jgi:hypothetical protein
MLQWLKRRLVNWAERYQERQIATLREESRSLKARLLELNGGKPIELSPEQRARLKEKRKHIDPVRLKELEVLPLDDGDSPDRNAQP